jgi:uncharacterized protein YndB with AHSA1/START domain
MTIVHDTFTIERIYDTSVGRLYEAFADPELKAKWFVGPEGWTELERKTDFRVGGVDVTHGRHVGNVESKCVATYHEIVPDQRIVFVYDMWVNGGLISVTLATAAFAAKGKSAQLAYSEQSVYFDTPFAPASKGPAGRKQGTEQLLDQLARAV